MIKKIKVVNLIKHNFSHSQIAESIICFLGYSEFWGIAEIDMNEKTSRVKLNKAAR